MNQLVYLVYGNISNIIDEARFSILSAIYHTSDNNTQKIVVVTDTAEAFSDLPVSIKKISAQELTEWSGSEKYHHRSKPNALLKVLGDANKTILIDTDTMFKKDPAQLFELVDDNSILVDEISQEWSKTPEQYYHTCRDFLAATYGTDDNLRHVNSGLIGLTKKNQKTIKDTINIIDQIYVMSEKLFHTEQFSLAVSLAFNKLNVKTHNKVIHHYWSRKSVYREIARSFLRSHTDLLGDTAKHDFLNLRFSVPRPPWYSRLKLKLFSKTLKNETQLRQFYIELGKALYPYKNIHNSIQTEMLAKALVNLKERNHHLFVQVQKNGVQSIIGRNLLNNASIERINNIAKKQA